MLGLTLDLDQVMERLSEHEDWLKDLDDDLEEETKARKELEARIDALEGKSPKPGKDDAGLAARMAAAEAKLSALQAAVAALQAKQDRAAQSVKAPFQVVDGSGRALFFVGERLPQGGVVPRVGIAPGAAGNYGVRIYDKSGSTIAAIGETSSAGGGGSLVLADAQSHPRITLLGQAAKISLQSATAKDLIVLSGERDASLKINDNVGTTRAELGGEPDGRYSLSLFGKDTKPLVKLTQAKSGQGGAAGVFGKSGTLRVLMDGGGGTLTAMNEQSQPLALIGEDEGNGVVGILSNGATLAGIGVNPATHAGRLWANDNDGNWLFKAGKNEDGGAACVANKRGVNCVGSIMPLAR